MAKSYRRLHTHYNQGFPGPPPTPAPAPLVVLQAGTFSLFSDFQSFLGSVAVSVASYTASCEKILASKKRKFLLITKHRAGFFFSFWFGAFFVCGFLFEGIFVPFFCNSPCSVWLVVKARIFWKLFFGKFYLNSSFWSLPFALKWWTLFLMYFYVVFRCSGMFLP